MLSLKSGVAKQSDTDLSVIYWLCVVLLALGSLMTVIGFLGCCGAARESQCLLGSVSINSKSNEKKVVIECTLI